MTVPIKICDFCQQEVPYKPLEAMKNFRIHFCSTCMAEYVYWGDDGSRASRHLYTYVNNRLYRWSVNNDDSSGYLFYVGSPGVPGDRPNREMKLLKFFKKDLPDVNPQNVQDKVKTILLFM